jgi:hypothetical protein
VCSLYGADSTCAAKPRHSDRICTQNSVICAGSTTLCPWFQSKSPKVPKITSPKMAKILHQSCKNTTLNVLFQKFSHKKSQKQLTKGTKTKTSLERRFTANRGKWRCFKGTTRFVFSATRWRRRKRGRASSCVFYSSGAIENRTSKFRTQRELSSNRFAFKAQIFFAVWKKMRQLQAQYFQAYFYSELYDIPGYNPYRAGTK